MDTVKLDELMKIKKKGDTSKANKDLYREQMVALFRDKGYVNMTEKYFYEGFSFCGALPFIEFMKESNDKEALYQSTKLGQYYNSLRHNGITFKFCVNLLAYILVELPNEDEMINDLIKTIPDLSITRNGKRSKEISTVFKKYFLNTLKDKKLDLPSLDTRIGRKDVKEFIELINEAFSTYQPKTPKEILTLSRVSKWIEEDKQISQNEMVNKVVDNSREDNKDKGKDFDEKLVQKVAHNWRHNLQAISKSIEYIEKEKRLLLDENKQLKNELKVKEDELHKNNLKLVELQKEITEFEDINKQLSFEKRNMEKKNKEYIEQITQSKEEIEERKRMYSIVQKDNNKKSEEVINRLASELKYDYIDYLDAKGQEMSIDLGENMRCQLESLFKVLGKYGVINK